MHRRAAFALRAVLVLLLVAGLALAAQTAPVRKSASELVAHYRARAQELIERQGEMGWASWVEGKPSDQASLYREYSEIFTREAIASTAAVLAGTKDPTQRKALSFFKAYQEVEYIGAQTATFDDMFMDLQANLHVTVDGRSMPYRELHGLLSREADRGKRLLLAEEEYRAYDLFNRVLLERQLKRAHELARDLGYASYTDLAVAYRMFDARALAAVCERFLDESEALYLSLFDRVSPIPRSEFRRADTLFLLGAREFDAFFPKEALIPRMDELLAGLGIDRAAQPNLRVDDREIAEKEPRAVCFSIRVPDDIRLSIKPVGGKDDYSSLFHEMGHGQHFANTKTKVWEFQQLGPNAVTESFAYLFENLLENPRWVADHTTMDAATRKRYGEHAAFSRLYMARRYMAKYLYELKLHAGEKDPQKLYQTLMSRGYGYSLTEREATRYLSDVDPYLYAADYVQAFFLEAELAHKLTQDFGDRWWTRPEAGAYLRTLYARGNELTGAELGALLGYPEGFDPAVFLAGVRELLEG